MSVKSFGFNQQGEEILLYTIGNENIEFSVMNYGAVMVSLKEKKSGIDVLLGYDSAEGYLKEEGHLGSFVGRTANRIKDAKFELNGVTYQLEKNDGENNLHGGNDGFDTRMYEAEETETTLKFHRISPDGESGFPGDLDVTILYTLQENSVEMRVFAKALNKDTLFCWTNHNYYNADGSDTILDQVLTIPAETYADCSPDNISVLPVKPVENTAFDFRNGKPVGTDIESDDPQITANRGYDHHFAVDGEGLRTFAVFEGKQVKVTVSSDMPGMHVYSGNFLNQPGKNGMMYHIHSGICFEPEYFPNAINYEGVTKPILRSGETSEHVIVMRVEPR